MKKYDKQPWSTSERHVLRDYYYVLGMEHLLEVLPGRTPELNTKTSSLPKETRLVL